MSTEEVRLGDVCKLINGGNWTSDEYAEKGIPVVRVSDMKNGTVDVSDLKHLEKSKYERYKKHELREGDLVLATVGSHKTSSSAAGRATIIPDYVDGMLLNQNAVCLRTDSDKLDQRYLCYLGKSSALQSYLQTMGKGAANQMRISLSAIRDYKFELPSIQKQERVADILSAFDDLIKINQERIEQLERVARLLFREWFVHHRFPGHEHTEFIDGIPASWERVSATDIIDVKPKMPTLNGQEVWYVPMAALSEQGAPIDLSEARKREKQTSVRFRNGDVLFARITPCLENGKTALVQFLDDGEIATGSTEFIVLRGNNVSSAFTYCLSRTYDFRQNAIKSMTGSSGRQRVQTECFDRFTMGLPPQHLRDEFNNVAGSCFEQIHLLQQQNRELKRARDTLLPRLMSGEITV